MATGASTLQTPATTTPTDSDSFLESIIPGYSKLAGQTSNIISNLLTGTPSPSTTQQAAATFGNANGLGTGSGIVNNYGYNLYNEKGQANQQQGIGDLLNTISATSSPVLSNQAQQLSNTQYYSGLNQNQNQFDTSNQLNQFLAQLQALGLGNSIVGNGNSLPTINF